MRALHKVGQDINETRRRRRITIKLLAQRAGISQATLAKIERGDGNTSIGRYAMVLFSLNMIDRLKDLVDVKHDLIGHRLEEDRLPKRVRMPRRKTKE